MGRMIEFENQSLFLIVEACEVCRSRGRPLLWAGKLEASPAESISPTTLDLSARTPV